MCGILLYQLGVYVLVWFIKRKRPEELATFYELWE